ncbi:histidine phosphatase family protein [Deinococcus koreensis]|uniref:Histidine phosphatase family protein n=1 Tax=Deinococcus koreensis TaxID=2054903 RepID=A0A2K3V2D1_9DEIO|nr:histidine phosphatase family protein [Deinococcus koreensis]
MIRHAQSVNNALEGRPDSLEARQADPPLTALGCEQARRLADWSPTDDLCRRITHLYSSLTTRAVQTAAPLAHALGLDVQGLTDAYECGGLSTGPAGGFTPVAGRDHDSLLLDCPTLLWPAEIQGQGWDGGCEPWDSTGFARRAARVTARLRATGGADVIALITHHDFAQHLIADLLGLPELDGEAPTFRLNNTATAYIEVSAGPAPTERRVLHWLGRVAHLPPESVTR